MDKAQAFGRDVRHKETTALGRNRKLIFARLQSLFLGHRHRALILGILLLILIVVAIVVFDKWVKSETQRVLLFAPGRPMSAIYKMGLSTQPRFTCARCELPMLTANAESIAAAM